MEYVKTNMKGKRRRQGDGYELKGSLELHTSCKYKCKDFRKKGPMMKIRTWAARDKDRKVHVYIGEEAPVVFPNKWVSLTPTGKSTILPPNIETYMRRAMKGLPWYKSLIELRPETWVPLEVEAKLIKEARNNEH
jgi:hypothetical protein